MTVVPQVKASRVGGLVLVLVLVHAVGRLRWVLASCLTASDHTVSAKGKLRLVSVCYSL